MVYVVFVDNFSFVVKFVGVVLEKDFVVLWIEVFEDKFIEILFGLFGNFEVGMLVFVIGNFFGLDYFLISGIISVFGWEIELVNGFLIWDVI